jgi:hypothetical protein
MLLAGLHGWHMMTPAADALGLPWFVWIAVGLQAMAAMAMKPLLVHVTKRRKHH